MIQLVSARLALQLNTRQVYKFDEGAEENVYAVVRSSFPARQLSITIAPLMLRLVGSLWLSQGRLDICKALRLARMCTSLCVNRNRELFLARDALKMAVVSFTMRLVININGIIMDGAVHSC